MLKQQYSTYIAAIEPLRFEALLGQTEQLNVIGSGSGQKIPEEVLRLSPDFLLLDGVLTGLDSLNLLELLRAQMPTPPRVLYLGREERWLNLARQKGADHAMLWNCTDGDLIHSALRTAEKPLPKLAKSWESARMEIAQKYADFLGIPSVLKGKDYICMAVSMLVCAPQLSTSYTGRLYPLIASASATTPSAVEKAIRTAVESTWLSGSLNAIQSLFGYSVDAERGKPTNAEFLAMLAGHARRELYHRMTQKTQ